MTNEELLDTIDELETRIRMLKDTVQRLNDRLHTLAAPAPKLPEEPGYYLTQQNRLLLKDEEGDWSARGLDGAPVDYFWEDGQAFTRDSAVIVSTLGVDAFPLVPISEVILPTKGKED